MSYLNLSDPSTHPELFVSEFTSRLTSKTPLTLLETHKALYSLASHGLATSPEVLSALKSRLAIEDSPFTDSDSLLHFTTIYRYGFTKEFLRRIAWKALVS